MEHTLEKIFSKIRPGADAKNSINIVDDFALDSFDIIDLITQMENIYNIKVDLSNIKIDDFRTFNSIENFIKENLK